MSIRRQSIISSLVIYLGFGVGVINIVLFGRYFSPEEYGLTTMFMTVCSLLTAIAGLSMPSYISKFYPYYHDLLPEKKNDQISLAIVISCIGFLLVLLAGWLGRDLVIRKFGENSPEFVTYYRWIFPLGLGMTLFSVLEPFAWIAGKSVLSNFFKEVLWRLLVTLLIVLYLFRVIDNYTLFIELFSLTYLVLVVCLVAYLGFQRRIHFTTGISKVTRRFRKKIFVFCLFVFSGRIVAELAQAFDTLVIASVLDDGMAKAGVFAIASLAVSIIQVPYRSVVSSSLPKLSRAWKDKNIAQLQRIYERSSINLLIAGAALYLLILLNYNDGIVVFGLREIYLAGYPTFLFLGLTRVIDLGTGVNEYILGTSNFWRFQLVSGIILLIMMLPLTYIFAKTFGITGPAVANLISITIYNFIRILFLYRKFKLFPFTRFSIYAILLASASYAVTYVLFVSMHNLLGMFLRSIFFLLIYISGVLYLRLSPDVLPVLATVRKRLRL